VLQRTQHHRNAEQSVASLHWQEQQAGATEIVLVAVGCDPQVGLFMRYRSIMTAVAALLALSGCKFESVPDPTLSSRDVQLLAMVAPDAPRAPDQFFGRYRVSNTTGEAPGTIVVNSAERKLYFVEDDATALRYPISVGQDAYRWTGEAVIREKREWPDWIPGDEARKLRPELPERVPGGGLNPLGARALYMFDENGKDTEIRIHGTNEPSSIGRAVSLGCIRMRNIDAIDLYNRVKMGAKVIVR
jgi:lipoprotein-anchoring transpeptidase ErfK/SrfK